MDEWTANLLRDRERGYWVSRNGIRHEEGCGCRASEPCTCEPPYPMKDSDG